MSGIVLLMATLTVSAQTGSASGIISYMEGRVEVSRNGAYLKPEKIVTGLRIEASDIVETGADGFVELQLSAPSAGSVVKIRPNSSFYFESSPPSSSKFSTVLQLLRGSLSMKVGRLTGRESYGVRTDTAVMAVRGTEFNVDMTSDRSVMVSVPEGTVESKTGSRSVMAQPGTIATIDDRSRLSAVSVDPKDIELYRQYWQGLRLEALKVNAKLSIQQYSRLWDQQKPRLENAMRAVQAKEKLLLKWENIVITGGTPPPAADLIRDKRELSPVMMELRAILPVAERTFNTLAGLEEAYNRGFVQGPFQAGAYPDAASFYRAFKADQERMKAILVKGRWMMRVYNTLDPDAPDIMSGPGF